MTGVVRVAELLKSKKAFPNFNCLLKLQLAFKDCSHITCASLNHSWTENILCKTVPESKVKGWNKGHCFSSFMSPDEVQSQRESPHGETDAAAHL